MKNLFSLTCVILLTTVTYGQQLEILKKSLDSITSLKKSYQQKILELDNEYSRINTIYKSNQFEYQDSTTYISVFNTKIYKDPSDLTGIGEIKAGDKVIILDQNTQIYKSTGYKVSFYKVSYNDVIGWVIKETITPIAEYQRKLKLAEEKVKEEKKAKADYKTGLIKKYGATNAQRILENKFWIGMTDKMAKESLGNPDDINRTVGSWGVNEQWIYGNTYLYFENGILTSYQN